MTLSRRDLAVAGALAVAFGATSLVGPALAEGGEEAAVKKAVEEMRTAYLNKDKAKLEAMTLPQLTYSHSDGRIEDRAQFIKGVMDRKATVKSLEYPELTVAIAGDVAIVRHLWVSETELDGKITNTKIGVMQVYKKQDGGWKLLARSSYRFPQQA
jgi:ketosteroid isomerase-like protein